ncbi:MAG: hypothetical protein ACE5IR_11530 [bacterium]
MKSTPKKAKRRRLIKSQIERLAKRSEHLRKLSNRFSWYRLSIVVAGLILGLTVYNLINHSAGWATLGATLFLFNIVAYFHRRVDLSVRKHEIWRQLKITQLARMDLDWKQLPRHAGSAADPGHFFETDLDITGEKSLHRLLDITISQDGSELLRQWLLESEPKLEAILTRQKIVKELAPLTRFRDKLLLAYKLISKEQLEGKKLLFFLEKHRLRSAFNWVLLGSLGLAFVNIALFLLNKFMGLPAFWIASLTLYAIVYFMNHDISQPLMDDAVFISDELKKFKAVSGYLESYKYAKNANLQRRCRPFWEKKSQPSKQLFRMTWVSSAIGLRMNPLLGLILNTFIPWDFLCAYFLEKNKAALTERLPLWLDVLFELEALVSLANFAYLNPDFVFPDILEDKKKTPFIFKAADLGHPLIPDDQKKCNDVVFRACGDVALITGSNMSGKSTFLKTIGANLCLAFAGGPVNAAELQTAVFRIFTCVHINDSVTDGFSFFYAEVRRLKALLTELDREHPLPLLFLIDEIFKGTNNRERYIGGRSYIQALAKKNGFGAVSTHDLDLTKLADTIANLSNYHFKEHVENGKMVFDYKLRPGPCPTTNALKIMRTEGLPVEEV